MVLNASAPMLSFLSLRPVLSFFFFIDLTFVNESGMFVGNWIGNLWNERSSVFDS